MSEIPHIVEVINSAKITSEFQGFIADVEFHDRQIYSVVTSVFKELKHKFTNINRPTEFVTYLKYGIINAFIHYNQDVYMIEHPRIATNEPYELGNAKILSYTTIGLILERTIQNTTRFEDLVFQITPDDHSFDELNQLIKEKYIRCYSIRI